MALYAIGDIQGCDRELGALLKKIRFSADRDQIWFVGDLVNRGPDSLAVLRRVRAMSDNAIAVLGNHDLHLGARYFGSAAAKKRDTLDAVLQAPDREPLMQWLIARPFMHVERSSALALLHAGLPPQWSITTAQECAHEAQQALLRDPARFVQTMYGDQPSLWDPALEGAERLRFITNCFTRMRYLRTDGSLDLKEKDAPAKADASKLRPWFECEPARWHGTRIVFGHWSTLGFFQNTRIICIDTGCVWGRTLTALRLDEPGAAPVWVNCELAASGPVSTPHR